MLPVSILGSLKNKKGFALMIAVGALAMMLTAGAALQSTSFAEVWKIGQTKTRSEARLGLSAAFEHALQDLRQGNIPNTAEEATVPTKSGKITYTISGEEKTAGELGPALGKYPADKVVVVVGMEAIAVYGGQNIPGSGVSEKSGRPSFSRVAVAVIDKANNDILLWMNCPSD